MSFKQWILDTYEPSELKDIVSHGCVSGCAHGAIYYHETMALYDKYHEEIWDALNEMAEEIGCGDALDFVSSFTDSNKVHSDHQFKNLLVWFYIEEIARKQEETQG